MKRVLSFALLFLFAGSVHLAASEENAKSIGKNAALLLTKTLMAELKTRTKKDKIEDVVNFCSDEAMKITQSLTEILPDGVSISRTSLKTRNKENNPTQKEMEILQTFQDEINRGESLKKSYLLENENNFYIYYKPLVIKKECLVCHGGSSDIKPVTAQKIDKLYPKDEAKGYKEGDLRGMIVVKMVDGVFKQ